MLPKEQALPLLNGEERRLTDIYDGQAYVPALFRQGSTVTTGAKCYII